jgi:DNA-binding NtrC family response regulator
MNPAITWSGNVRQIQSVARRVIMIVEDDEARSGTLSASPTITQEAVLTALKREFPTAYEQINNETKM